MAKFYTVCLVSLFRNNRNNEQFVRIFVPTYNTKKMDDSILGHEKKLYVVRENQFELLAM
nr:unnamed protein product [Callosobruchus analis]